MEETWLFSSASFVSPLTCACSFIYHSITSPAIRISWFTIFINFAPVFLTWFDSQQQLGEKSDKQVGKQKQQDALNTRKLSEFHSTSLACVSLPVCVSVCVRVCVRIYCCPWDRSQPLKLQTASISTSKVCIGKKKFSELECKATSCCVPFKMAWILVSSLLQVHELI